MKTDFRTEMFSSGLQVRTEYKKEKKQRMKNKESIYTTISEY